MSSFLPADVKGRVWAGTDHGVNVLYNGRTTLLDMQDGLIWNDTDWNAFLEENDGSVWIGTSSGVSHLLDPDAVLNRLPFNAEIDRPRYGRLNPGEHLLKPGSTTPWDRATFLIGFNGLTFRDNRTLLFHYRMEGLDAQTIETHSPFARFQQLPPGTYNFVVVAEDRGHNTFSTPAAFSFTLSPPMGGAQSSFSPSRSLSPPPFFCLSGAGAIWPFWPSAGACNASSPSARSSSSTSRRPTRSPACSIAAPL